MSGRPFPWLCTGSGKGRSIREQTRRQGEMGRAKEPAEKGEQENKAVNARDRQPCRREKCPVTVRPKKKRWATEGQDWQESTAAKARPSKRGSQKEKETERDGQLYIVQSVWQKITARQYTVSKNKKQTRYSNTEQHITQNICTQNWKDIYTRDTDRQGMIDDTGPTREHPVKDTEGQPRNTEGKEVTGSTKGCSVTLRQLLRRYTRTVALHGIHWHTLAQNTTPYTPEEAATTDPAATKAGRTDWQEVR